jgi:hypothetical protein
MSGPIHVDPLVVFRLSFNGFTRFCNDLLRAEAARVGVPQAYIDTTIRDTVPDGGIDARIRHATCVSTENGSQWLPGGASAWQYKSGSCPSVSQLSTEEFIKPEVIAAIDQGDTYCFLTADSLTARKKTAIADGIKDQYANRGQAPVEPRVYSGDDLARWAQENLGVASTHFLVPITGWQPFDQWANSPLFRNEYFPDEARSQLSPLAHGNMVPMAVSLCLGILA